MWVASASTVTVVERVVEDAAGRRRAGDVDGTSTVTFSPRFTMTRSTCSSVCLTGSRWTDLGSVSSLAAVELELEQHVGVLEREHQLVARERDVARARCRGRR